MNNLLKSLPQLKIKIFSGELLIPASLRNNYPHFQFMGPVKPGDVISAIDEKVHILAILDRDKDCHLALSVGEIVDGLRSGMKIYGASELGAIRAKECADMGMIGVGEVFNYLQKSLSFNEGWYYENHAGLSYIDLLFALEKIPSLSFDLKQSILDSYESLHYQERSLEKIALTQEQKLVFTSQKKSDAELLLKKIQMDIKENQKINTSLWERQKKQLDNSECELKWKTQDE